MIIDFHAHLYPGKIAAKASKAISDFYEEAPMEYSGLTEELIKSGSKIGVTKYLVHSVASNPAQVQSINNFLKAELDAHPDLFVCYGAMHQDYEDFENEFKRIKELGFKGVKLHPDIQRFAVDDPKMDKMYDSMAAMNLPVLLHAGDCRYDFSGPKRIRNVLDKHPDLKVIAAHFGGYTEWEASEKYLAGQNVYFDTSSTFWKLSFEDCNRLIKKHGYEKFFFGSDFPMWDHEKELANFNKLDLTAEEKEAILYKNAAKFLGL